MPSIVAPARPRRPIRRMHRTRGLLTPILLARAAVPSGESSSTNMTSHSMPGSATASRSTRIGMLALSLNVGTTTVSSGSGKAAAVCDSGAGSIGLMTVTVIRDSHSLEEYMDLNYVRGERNRSRLAPGNRRVSKEFCRYNLTSSIAGEIAQQLLDLLCALRALWI